MNAANVASIRSAGSEPERKITASMPLQDQLSTLDALIRRPPNNSRVIEFSPQLAQHVLTKLNRNNRQMKPVKIKKYAGDISDEAWGLTGDTIKFGSDGLLKDGQNRLSACIRAQRPMTSHVVFGIDPQLFARMDIGKNRNGADVFTIAGISRANHVSVAVRWLLILTGGDPSDRGAQFSNEELLTAHREKFDGDRLERSIHAALAVKKTCRHPVGPLAALHYLFSERHEMNADAFFEEWATGRSKKVRAPAKALQNRLVEIATASNNRVHENVRNALIIKAWNSYLAGRTVSKAEMHHAITDPMPMIAK